MGGLTLIPPPTTILRGRRLNMNFKIA